MTLRERWRLLWWALSGGGDVARHDALARRHPGALVLRAQAIREVRDSLRGHGVVELPNRDTHFSVVVGADGVGLWAGGSRPNRFLLVPWSDVVDLAVRAFRDSRVRDLVALDGGRRTHVLQVLTGSGPVELAIWGQDELDHTTSLLDDYGLRGTIRMIRAVRAGLEPDA